MKRAILIITIIFLSNSTNYSQNWCLLNPDYKYNYSNSEISGITNTVWIDSIHKFDADTIFYLNRIVVECDTCPPFVNGLSRYTFFNRPQFLQKQVRKYSNTYCFTGSNQFLIKQFANISDSWIFDTINNISATVLNEIETTTFEHIDSAKIIGLSTEDTIIISKNFGILRFDDIYENKAYFLKGIEGYIGESVPDFFDIYNFNVGDVFEYYGEIRQVESDPRIYKEKVEILDKRGNGEILEYDVNVKYYNRELFIPPWGEYSSEYAYSRIYSSTWKFEYKPNHPVNYFNNQMVDIMDFYELSDFNCEYSHTKMRCFQDTNGIFSKIVCSLDSADFYKISDTTNNIFERMDSPGLCDEYEYHYKNGLGEVYYANSGFEWGTTRELVAYKKGNDTIGSLTPDEKLIVNVENYENSDIKIYPNPASEIIYVETSSGKTIDKIYLVDVNGISQECSTFKDYLNVENVHSGLYYLVVDIGSFKIRRPVIVMH